MPFYIGESHVNTDMMGPFRPVSFILDIIGGPVNSGSNDPR